MTRLSSTKYFHSNVLPPRRTFSLTFCICMRILRDDGSVELLGAQLVLSAKGPLTTVLLVCLSHSIHTKPVLIHFYKYLWAWEVRKIICETTSVFTKSKKQVTVGKNSTGYFCFLINQHAITINVPLSWITRIFVFTLNMENRNSQLIRNIKTSLKFRDIYLQ